MKKKSVPSSSAASSPATKRHTSKSTASKKAQHPKNKNTIRTLTLLDIKGLLSSKEEGNKLKKELVRIASKKYRESLYEEAAEYISNKEIASWPTFGGREWICKVKIDEGKRSKDNVVPLFRWKDGNLELACLSEALEDIPTEFSNKDKMRVTSDGCMNMKNYIDRIWVSPQLQHFRTRKNALECAMELDRRKELVNRVFNGIGNRGKLLSPFKPSRAQALEVGLYKFEQDGLWVVGQEEAWQEERANVLGVKMPKTSHKIGRLAKSDQDLCYSCCLQHYDAVLYTVKARSLYSELEHGFDVLRERGRGRYDMEIPAFDKPELSILTSKHAPWMPVIRTILGEEAVLIHKGCFLSLPGSDTQVYHQDGVHLSNTHQRPCHAVNVFIPLVDLTNKNGPTEFCKGTHILGNDHFQKQNIKIPLVKAGTPIVFDYRLGHRGLGNTTMNEVRPILYLTYASNSFKDSVNFSRKRYVKIGELVSLPISRTERALQRAEKISFNRNEK